MDKNINKALEMLSKALDMEKEGKKFYKKILSQCQNDLGVEIFTMLIKDESMHIKKIIDIYDTIKDEKKWPTELKKIKTENNDVHHIINSMLSKHGNSIKTSMNDMEAIDIALDLENKSITFYKAQLKNASDSIEKIFIEKMIEEEKSHHLALADMKLYLTDPSSWFAEHEHIGLDGA
uniref:Rubrerythrin diiron-binding domain-containing protein n=1 Tax=uncultured delta proteobacterium TaxID=34034 RepID=Q2YZU1_9DELT|nr:hypothetical protein [uncultured delta proteobacterium]